MTRQTPNSRTRLGRGAGLSLWPRLTTKTDPGEWTRRQVRCAIGLLVLAVLLVATGGVLSLTGGSHTTGTRPTGRASEVAPVAPEDQIADRPMPTATLDQARPSPLSTADAPSLVVPAATQLGPAGVPSGFPQTGLGAVAQLAAIDSAALGGGSVPRAQEVVSAWTTTGGPTAQTWSGVRAVAELLSAAGLPADGGNQMDLTIAPAMALIKGELPETAQPSVSQPGTSQPATATQPGSLTQPQQQQVQAGDATVYVVPCLDMVLTVTWGQQTHQVAVADCQRMVWQAGRWVLGPGPEPAPAPSLWPGSAESYQVGYQWLTSAAS